MSVTLLMDCEDPDRTMTFRENEVLFLVVKDTPMSKSRNAEIAARLEISNSTVETHRSNLTRKLGLAAFKFLDIGGGASE